MAIPAPRDSALLGATLEPKTERCSEWSVADSARQGSIGQPDEISAACRPSGATDQSFCTPPLHVAEPHCISGSEESLQQAEVEEVEYEQLTTVASPGRREALLRGGTVLNPHRLTADHVLRAPARLGIPSERSRTVSAPGSLATTTGRLAPRVSWL